MSAEPTTVEQYLRALTQANADLAARLDSLLTESLLGPAAGDTWTAKFLRGRIAQATAEIERVKAEVLGLAGVDGLAAKAAEEAYSVGLVTADAALTAQGIAAPAADFADLHAVQSRLIAQAMTDGYNGMYTQLLRSVHDDYREVQARAAMVSNLAGEDIGKHTARILKDLRAKGLTGFTTQADRFGRVRRWNLEDYSAMLGRTVAANAAREASLQRTAEVGISLVLIVGGRIETTCETCRHLDGKVISIGAPPEVKPENYAGTLEEAKRRKPPFGHPNCIHHLAPWVPDAGPSDEDLRQQVEDLGDELGMDVSGLRRAVGEATKAG